MHRLLPRLVTDAAHRHAAAPAVVMDGVTLDYGTLEERSNRFARSLVAHGVRRGDRVAMWLPKSPDAIVALYGIMKAGAAYVPVDPGAPAVRLGYIARDCEVAGLVTTRDRASALDETFGGRAPMRALWFADLDDPRAESPRVAGLPGVPWAALAAEKGSGFASPALEDDLAYILYTSGSTGEPKGVMLTHRNCRVFTDWAAETFGLTERDRVANQAPLHFDLSTFDLFASAHAGAALYPVSPRIAAFPAAVAIRWAQERLSVWYCTPSSLVLMLTRGALDKHDLSSLRVLLFAGEVFPNKYLRQLMALAPHARYANLYGPTETNVCTWLEVTAPPEGDAPLSIGRACPFDESLVLDDALRPVPTGGIGELWVRGASVMRGYWGKPERTALSLQTIDIAPGIRDKAYRTGDLVRTRPDGNLEFLGRRDHQVKTRGYRVELGEIETRLATHPAVDEAVVVAIPDDEVTNRLKAVVVAKPDAVVGADELKQHCAATLPRYMVPESVEFRAQLPRTSSGKVDRKLLADTIPSKDTR
ncbi:MAG TPA: amino acid adenylation domain-containing protein [Candidatus Eisenbacteria bacterium]|jgi:amino acid adenylation domain-containing protein